MAGLSLGCARLEGSPPLSVPSQNLPSLSLRYSQVYPLAPSFLFRLPNRQGGFSLERSPLLCWPFFMPSIGFPDPTPNCPQCTSRVDSSLPETTLSWTGLGGGGGGGGGESSLEKGKKTSSHQLFHPRVLPPGWGGQSAS